VARSTARYIVVISLCLGILALNSHSGAVTIKEVKSGESVFEYVDRVRGRFNQTLYQQVIGAANPHKEGDEAMGLAADGEITRLHARMLLSSTKVKDLHKHPLFEDNLQELIWETTDRAQYHEVKHWTLGELKDFLLAKPENDIKGIMGGLNSDVIACVAKIMTNAELTLVGRKISNPLPGSNLGAKGYVGGRIQPNSPQNDPEDIVWPVFDAWCYATGDLVIGTNPVAGDVETVRRIQRALQDVVVTFGLEDVIPWCVVTHIHDQAACEELYPGSTSLWFQRLAGCDDANETLGVSIRNMMTYAKMRTWKYGLYHETGQGDDFISGAGNGFDMVVHESRKYGFSRALKKEMAKVAPGEEVWSHTNSGGGFNGPEVFNTPGQLVRCCLEDIFMGKLHGLTMGVDICSRLPMLVSLADLNWCVDQIMPANPAYLKAVPAKIDPMLNYFTTSYQDHLRLRHKFGYKVDDAMWAFFKGIGIVDYNNNYTEHLGDPIWVYYQYRRAKGDERTKGEIYEEGEAAIQRVEARGVPIARGFGQNFWDLEPALDKRITSFYDDVKASYWAELTPEFLKTVPNAVVIATISEDREDFFVRPATSRKLSKSAVATLARLRKNWADKGPDVQIVISDGLNANAIMDEGHLKPYLQAVRMELKKARFAVGKENIVIKNGRVQAGYSVGEVIFKESDPARFKVVLHIIGETPEAGHESFSVYITAAQAGAWDEKKRDSYSVETIRGVSETAFKPTDAAIQTVELIIDITQIKTHDHLLTLRDIPVAEL